MLYKPKPDRITQTCFSQTKTLAKHVFVLVKNILDFVFLEVFGFDRKHTLAWVNWGDFGWNVLWFLLVCIMVSFYTCWRIPGDAVKNQSSSGQQNREGSSDLDDFWINSIATTQSIFQSFRTNEQTNERVNRTKAFRNIKPTKMKKIRRQRL